MPGTLCLTRYFGNSDSVMLLYFYIVLNIIYTVFQKNGTLFILTITKGGTAAAAPPPSGLVTLPSVGAVP